jgi:hypothetical protein
MENDVSGRRGRIRGVSVDPHAGPGELGVVQAGERVYEAVDRLRRPGADHVARSRIGRGSRVDRRRHHVAEVVGCPLKDRDVPRKQRHTARRVWQRLVAEHGATLAEVTVSRYVARRKIALGLDQREVAVPQTHPPGAEAEVDFGEFYATVAGVWIKLWMFVMRLSHSGRAFHVAFATQAQEAFLQGHVLAFQHFGAVPGRINTENVPRNIFGVLWPAELCGEACIGRRRRVFVGGLRGT